MSLGHQLKTAVIFSIATETQELRSIIAADDFVARARSPQALSIQFRWESVKFCLITHTGVQWKALLCAAQDLNSQTHHYQFCS